MFDGGAEGTTHNKTVGCVAHEPLLVTRITPIRAGRDLTKPRIHNTAAGIPAAKESLY